MEEVGGCRTVDDLPVRTLGLGSQVASSEPGLLINLGGLVGMLVDHLKKPLYPTATVLGTLTVVSVWQEYCQSILPIIYLYVLCIYL